jgi:hypothetical protein
MAPGFKHLVQLHVQTFDRIGGVNHLYLAQAIWAGFIIPAALACDFVRGMPGFSRRGKLPGGVPTVDAQLRPLRSQIDHIWSVCLDEARHLSGRLL